MYFARVILLVILSLFMHGSVKTQELVDHRIVEFEKFLGKDKSEALSELVSVFEIYLAERYKNENIEESYADFLHYIINSGEVNLNIDLDDVLLIIACEKYHLSGLNDEVTYLLEDVTQRGDSLIFEWSYYDEPDTLSAQEIHWINEKYTSHQLDSIRKTKYKEFYFNLNGRYFRGLRKAGESDAVVMKYVDAKEALRGLSPAIVASGMLESKADFSDYFIKRILTIELFNPCFLHFKGKLK